MLKNEWRQIAVQNLTEDLFNNQQSLTAVLAAVKVVWEVDKSVVLSWTFCHSVLVSICPLLEAICIVCGEQIDFAPILRSVLQHTRWTDLEQKSIRIIQAHVPRFHELVEPIPLHLWIDTRMVDVFLPCSWVRGPDRTDDVSGSRPVAMGACVSAR